MRYTLLLLLLLTVSLRSVARQDKLTKDDSVKISQYWKKANQCWLHSVQRQLYLDSALAIDPHNAYFWQQKSMPLSKMMKHELAAPYLDSAAKYNPKEYVPYRGYIRCIFSRHYRDALTDFYLSKNINGNSGVMDHPYDFFIGLCHLQSNNFDSARWYFEKCIEDRKARNGADWVHYIHHFYNGITWYEQVQYDKAIACFDESLRLNPGLPEALYYKSICMTIKGDDQTALALAEKADSLMKRGYFINEDNARYEYYPYQVRKYYLDAMLNRLRESNK